MSEEEVKEGEQEQEQEQIQTVAEALASAPFFSSASPRGLQRLSDRTQLENRPGDEVIFERGEPSRHVFIVRSGTVLITNPDPSGKPQVQSTLGPGAIFGELGVLAGRARTASAKTDGPTDLWVIDGEAFVELFSAEPPVAIEVITSLARYVLDAEGVTEDLLFLDLKGRVSKRLLFLAGVRDGQPMPGLLDEINIDLGELSALSGGTRENVTRLIESFERDGYVARQGQAIVILQPEALLGFATA